jgi:hypothetical protein
MDKLGKIARLINERNEDIRAEVIAANLMEEGLDAESIAVLYQGQFKRSFSPDILAAEVIKLNDYQKVVALNLSRDSFYDCLPEGLFHEFSSSPLESGKEMAHESKGLKKQEEESRKFFRPIEQEYFHHRVLLEKEERRLLNKIGSRQYQDIFRAFWKISPGLPPGLVSGMILILPFAHRIAGDYSLTAACLSALLKEDVNYRVFTVKKIFEPEEGNKSVSTRHGGLGHCTLGGDLISGHSFHEVCPAIEFNIGPLTNSEIDDYMGSGSRVDFIRTFFSFFVPVNMECSFQVVKPVDYHFILSVGNEATVMGYNSVI